MPPCMRGCSGSAKNCGTSATKHTSAMHRSRIVKTCRLWSIARKTKSIAAHIGKYSHAIQPVTKQYRTNFLGALCPNGRFAPDRMEISAPKVTSESLSGIENIESQPNATVAIALSKVAHSQRSPALRRSTKSRHVQAEQYSASARNMRRGNASPNSSEAPRLSTAETGPYSGFFQYSTTTLSFVRADIEGAALNSPMVAGKSRK